MLSLQTLRVHYQTNEPIVDYDASDVFVLVALHHTAVLLDFATSCVLSSHFFKEAIKCVFLAEGSHHMFIITRDCTLYRLETKPYRAGYCIISAYDLIQSEAVGKLSPKALARKTSYIDVLKVQDSVMTTCGIVHIPNGIMGIYCNISSFCGHTAKHPATALRPTLLHVLYLVHPNGRCVTHRFANYITAIAYAFSTDTLLIGDDLGYVHILDPALGMKTLAQPFPETITDIQESGSCTVIIGYRYGAFIQFHYVDVRIELFSICSNNHTEYRDIVDFFSERCRDSFHGDSSFLNTTVTDSTRVSIIGDMHEYFEVARRTRRQRMLGITFDSLAHGFRRSVVTSIAGHTVLFVVFSVYLVAYVIRTKPTRRTAYPVFISSVSSMQMYPQDGVLKAGTSNISIRLVNNQLLLCFAGAIHTVSLPMYLLPLQRCVPDLTLSSLDNLRGDETTETTEDATHHIIATVQPNSHKQNSVPSELLQVPASSCANKPSSYGTNFTDSKPTGPMQTLMSSLYGHEQRRNRDILSQKMERLFASKGVKEFLQIPENTSDSSESLLLPDYEFSRGILKEDDNGLIVTPRISRLEYNGPEYNNNIAPFSPKEGLYGFLKQRHDSRQEQLKLLLRAKVGELAEQGYAPSRIARILGIVDKRVGIHEELTAEKLIEYISQMHATLIDNPGYKNATWQQMKHFTLDPVKAPSYCSPQDLKNVKEARLFEQLFMDPRFHIDGLLGTLIGRPNSSGSAFKRTVQNPHRSFTDDYARVGEMLPVDARVLYDISTTLFSDQQGDSDSEDAIFSQPFSHSLRSSIAMTLPSKASCPPGASRGSPSWKGRVSNVHPSHIYPTDSSLVGSLPNNSTAAGISTAVEPIESVSITRFQSCGSRGSTSDSAKLPSVSPSFRVYNGVDDLCTADLSVTQTEQSSSFANLLLPQPASVSIDIMPASFVHEVVEQQDHESALQSEPTGCSARNVAPGGQNAVFKCSIGDSDARADVFSLQSSRVKQPAIGSDVLSLTAENFRLVRDKMRGHTLEAFLKKFGISLITKRSRNTLIGGKPCQRAAFSKDKGMASLSDGFQEVVQPTQTAPRRSLSASHSAPADTVAPLYFALSEQKTDSLPPYPNPSSYSQRNECVLNLTAQQQESRHLISPSRPTTTPKRASNILQLLSSPNEYSTSTDADVRPPLLSTGPHNQRIKDPISFARPLVNISAIQPYILEGVLENAIYPFSHAVMRRKRHFQRKVQHLLNSSSKASKRYTHSIEATESRAPFTIQGTFPGGSHACTNTYLEYLASAAAEPLGSDICSSHPHTAVSPNYTMIQISPSLLQLPQQTGNDHRPSMASRFNLKRRDLRSSIARRYPVCSTVQSSKSASFWTYNIDGVSATIDSGGHPSNKAYISCLPTRSASASSLPAKEALRGSSVAPTFGLHSVDFSVDTSNTSCGAPYYHTSSARLTGAPGLDAAPSSDSVLTRQYLQSGEHLHRSQSSFMRQYTQTQKDASKASLAQLLSPACNTAANLGSRDRLPQHLAPLTSKTDSVTEPLADSLRSDIASTTGVTEKIPGMVESEYFSRETTMRQSHANGCIIPRPSMQDNGSSIYPASCLWPYAPLDGSLPAVRTRHEWLVSRAQCDDTHRVSLMTSVPMRYDRRTRIFYASKVQIALAPYHGTVIQSEPCTISSSNTSAGSSGILTSGTTEQTSDAYVHAPVFGQGMPDSSSSQMSVCDINTILFQTLSLLLSHAHEEQDRHFIARYLQGIPKNMEPQSSNKPSSGVLLPIFWQHSTMAKVASALAIIGKYYASLRTNRNLNSAMEAQERSFASLSPLAKISFIQWKNQQNARNRAASRSPSSNVGLENTRDAYPFLSRIAVNDATYLFALPETDQYSLRQLRALKDRFLPLRHSPGSVSTAAAQHIHLDRSSSEAFAYRVQTLSRILGVNSNALPRIPDAVHPPQSLSRDGADEAHYPTTKGGSLGTDEAREPLASHKASAAPSKVFQHKVYAVSDLLSPEVAYPGSVGPDDGHIFPQNLSHPSGNASLGKPTEHRTQRTFLLKDILSIFSALGLRVSANSGFTMDSDVSDGYADAEQSDGGAAVRLPTSLPGDLATEHLLNCEIIEKYHQLPTKTPGAFHVLGATDLAKLVIVSYESADICHELWSHMLPGELLGDDVFMSSLTTFCTRKRTLIAEKQIRIEELLKLRRTSDDLRLPLAEDSSLPSTESLVQRSGDPTIEHSAPSYGEQSAFERALSPRSLTSHNDAYMDASFQMLPFERANEEKRRLATDTRISSKDAPPTKQLHGDLVLPLLLPQNIPTERVRSMSSRMYQNESFPHAGESRGAKTSRATPRLLYPHKNQHRGPGNRISQYVRSSAGFANHHRRSPFSPREHPSLQSSRERAAGRKDHTSQKRYNQEPRSARHASKRIRLPHQNVIHTEKQSSPRRKKLRRNTSQLLGDKQIDVSSSDASDSTEEIISEESVAALLSPDSRTGFQWPTIRYTRAERKLLASMRYRDPYDVRLSPGKIQGQSGAAELYMPGTLTPREGFNTVPGRSLSAQDLLGPMRHLCNAEFTVKHIKPQFLKLLVSAGLDLRRFTQESPGTRSTPFSYAIDSTFQEHSGVAMKSILDPQRTICAFARTVRSKDQPSPRSHSQSPNRLLEPKDPPIYDRLVAMKAASSASTQLKLLSTCQHNLSQFLTKEARLRVLEPPEFEARALDYFSATEVAMFNRVYHEVFFLNTPFYDTACKDTTSPLFLDLRRHTSMAPSHPSVHAYDDNCRPHMSASVLDTALSSSNRVGVKMNTSSSMSDFQSIARIPNAAYIANNTTTDPMPLPTYQSPRRFRTCRASELGSGDPVFHILPRSKSAIFSSIGASPFIDQRKRNPLTKQSLSLSPRGATSLSAGARVKYELLYQLHRINRWSNPMLRSCRLLDDCSKLALASEWQMSVTRSLGGQITRSPMADSTHSLLSGLVNHTQQTSSRATAVVHKRLNRRLRHLRTSFFGRFCGSMESKLKGQHMHQQKVMFSSALSPFDVLIGSGRLEVPSAISSEAYPSLALISNVKTLLGGMPLSQSRAYPCRGYITGFPKWNRMRERNCHNSLLQCSISDDEYASSTGVYSALHHSDVLSCFREACDLSCAIRRYKLLTLQNKIPSRVLTHNPSSFSFSKDCTQHGCEEQAIQKPTLCAAESVLPRPSSDNDPASLVDTAMLANKSRTQLKELFKDLTRRNVIGDFRTSGAHALDALTVEPSSLGLALEAAAQWSFANMHFVSFSDSKGLRIVASDSLIAEYTSCLFPSFLRRPQEAFYSCLYTWGLAMRRHAESHATASSGFLWFMDDHVRTLRQLPDSHVEDSPDLCYESVREIFLTSPYDRLKRHARLQSATKRTLQQHRPRPRSKIQGKDSAGSAVIELSLTKAMAKRSRSAFSRGRAAFSERSLLLPPNSRYSTSDDRAPCFSDRVMHPSIDKARDAESLTDSVLQAELERDRKVASILSTLDMTKPKNRRLAARLRNRLNPRNPRRCRFATLGDDCETGSARDTPRKSSHTDSRRIDPRPHELPDRLLELCLLFTGSSLVERLAHLFVQTTARVYLHYPREFSISCTPQQNLRSSPYKYSVSNAKPSSTSQPMCMYDRATFLECFLFPVPVLDQNHYISAISSIESAIDRVTLLIKDRHYALQNQFRVRALQYLRMHNRELSEQDAPLYALWNRVRFHTYHLQSLQLMDSISSARESQETRLSVREMMKRSQNHGLTEQELELKEARRRKILDGFERLIYDVLRKHHTLRGQIAQIACLRYFQDNRSYERLSRQNPQMTTSTYSDLLKEAVQTYITDGPSIFLFYTRILNMEYSIRLYRAQVESGILYQRFGSIITMEHLAQLFSTLSPGSMSASAGSSLAEPTRAQSPHLLTARVFSRSAIFSDSQYANSIVCSYEQGASSVGVFAFAPGSISADDHRRHPFVQQQSMIPGSGVLKNATACFSGASGRNIASLLGEDSASSSQAPNLLSLASDVSKPSRMLSIALAANNLKAANKDIERRVELCTNGKLSHFDDTTSISTDVRSSSFFSEGVADDIQQLTARSVQLNNNLAREAESMEKVLVPPLQLSRGSPFSAYSSRLPSPYGELSMGSPGTGGFFTRRVPSTRVIPWVKQSISDRLRYQSEFSPTADPDFNRIFTRMTASAVKRGMRIRGIDDMQGCTTHGNKEGLLHTFRTSLTQNLPVGSAQQQDVQDLGHNDEPSIFKVGATPTLYGPNIGGLSVIEPDTLTNPLLTVVSIPSIHSSSNPCALSPDLVSGGLNKIDVSISMPFTARAKTPGLAISQKACKQPKTLVSSYDPGSKAISGLFTVRTQKLLRKLASAHSSKVLFRQQAAPRDSSSSEQAGCRNENHSYDLAVNTYTRDFAVPFCNTDPIQSRPTTVSRMQRLDMRSAQNMLGSSTAVHENNSGELLDDKTLNQSSEVFTGTHNQLDPTQSGGRPLSRHVYAQSRETRTCAEQRARQRPLTAASTPVPSLTLSDAAYYRQKSDAQVSSRGMFIKGSSTIPAKYEELGSADSKKLHTTQLDLSSSRTLHSGSQQYSISSRFSASASQPRLLYQTVRSNSASSHARSLAPGVETSVPDQLLPDYDMQQAYADAHRQAPINLNDFGVVLESPLTVAHLRPSTASFDRNI